MDSKHLKTCDKECQFNSNAKCCFGGWHAIGKCFLEKPKKETPIARRAKNRKINDYQEVYERWWLGKMCKPHGADSFRKVVAVELVGPPSFVYGDVWLCFEDGSKSAVNCGDSFRPRKADVDTR